MNTLKFENKGNIKMVAHRGVSGLERENTLPAFVAAGVLSYYGIETDVHVTKDKKYIVHHDDTTERLTGKNLLLRETDFDTLRELRLKDLDEVTMRADLFLPTLDEYLSVCKKYGKVAVLELKEDMAKEDVVGIANVVNDMGMMDKTTFISFWPYNLVRLREAFPNANAQFLSDKITDEIINFVIEYKLDVDFHHKVITKEFVDLMHSHGKVVNAWTVNGLGTANRLLECGVDMITTNILE